MTVAGATATSSCTEHATAALTLGSHSLVRRRARGAPAALVALLVALVLAGCGGPQTVPLAELVADAEGYDGQQVITSGHVLEFDADDGALERHFVLQDSAANRVLLLPLEAAEEHGGALVEVLGQFEADEVQGRMLHVEEIDPLDDDGRL